MTDGTHSRSGGPDGGWRGAPGREFDVLLLGATGITGRLALAYLTERVRATGQSFAVGARDRDRVERLCREAGIPTPTVFPVDVTDRVSLADFAPRGRVVVNLVGPYTPSGPAVVAACVAAATSYVDATGETQFVRRTDAAWHRAARAAGVAVVQTAGFESLPADLAVDLARHALQSRGRRLIAADVRVTVRSAAGAALADTVSGGTVQSILHVLADADAPRLADVAFRVGDADDAAAVRACSPLRLWPRVTAGTVIAPMSPAAFIDPPVLHRTAWLLDREAARPHRPVRVREGLTLGSARGATGLATVAGALATTAFQAALLAAGRLPHPLRSAIAGLLRGMLPAAGTGPRGPSLDDWRWQLTARGISDARTAVEVRIDADGHPGYTTTARMIAELALLIADGGGTGRTGCITPALAVGPGGAARFVAAGMRFSVRPAP